MQLNISGEIERTLILLAGEDGKKPEELLTELVLAEHQERHQTTIPFMGKVPVRCAREHCFEHAPTKYQILMAQCEEQLDN